MVIIFQSMTIIIILKKDQIFFKIIILVFCDRKTNMKKKNIQTNKQTVLIYFS